MRETEAAKAAKQDGKDTTGPGREAERRAVRPVVATLAGAGTAGAAVLLVARAWNSCDIGTGGAANSPALLFWFLVLVGVATMWWGAVMGILAGRTLGGAIAVGLCGSLVLVWLFTLWQHAPDGYPATACAPDNVPPWWPGWLPL